MAFSEEESKYCNDLFYPSRLKTRCVSIGNLPLGGNSPVRIQSMTNTPTDNAEATVAQARRLFEAGCDYVRITARNISEAKKLSNIKTKLRHDGFRFPLIADIHFNPEAALVAARIVEKVRINPGNYVDKTDNKNPKKDWSVAEYGYELERIAERLAPLITVCKEEGTAIRVGTNHGSLSQRILSRYGNTPEGMVQSAMEFVRIFSGMGFHQLVLSMKSSNIRVMLHAYRLLVHKMMSEGFDYPLHIGVTEAGAGDDGIIRSAAGIGSLLADGIGDTIRVSLTGAPEQEIPVAKEIRKHFQYPLNPETAASNAQIFFDPFSYHRHQTIGVKKIGNGQEVVLLTKKDFDCMPSVEAVKIIQDGALLKNLSKDPSSVIVVDSITAQVRKLFSFLVAHDVKTPVILRFRTTENNFELARIKFATEISSLLIDGFGDAVYWDHQGFEKAAIEEAGLSLLQAHGLKRSKAEFVSCPTCGRTDFNIEKVLTEIKKRTSHLKHLKIAVMGCIVNGPGEMADADYGIVGMGKGEVAIYFAGKIVQKHIAEDQAAESLCRLIIEKGDWTDEEGS